MGRAQRLKSICAVMMVICLAVAFTRLAFGVLPLINPALTTGQIICEDDGCRFDANSLRLLPDGEREAVAISPSRRQQLDELIQSSRARLMLFASEAIRAVPAFLLFYGLAMVSRMLARGSGYGKAIPWLRRSADFAIVSVLARPLADTFRDSAVSSVTLGTESFFFSFDARSFVWGLLLAGAVWMALWVLDQARLVESELAEIV